MENCYNGITNGLFAISGIIVGAVLTYFVNRSQQKLQIKNDSIIWKRNKSIDVITKVLIKCQELDVRLIKDGSFSAWSDQMQKNLLPLVMIHLGYKAWADIQDEIIKLLHIVKLDFETQIKVLEIKKLYKEKGITDEYLDSLKSQDIIDLGNLLLTIQVNIETIMTEFLKDNYDEFRELDYRKTPKYETN